MNRQLINLLIDHGTVITMNPQRHIITDGCVAIKDNTIIAVGPSHEIHNNYTSQQTIDAQGHAVLPGFINGHAHGATSLLRGIADNQSLLTWLKDYILPLEHEVLSPEFVRTGTELALLEMIQGGITTVADMYHYEDIVAQTCSDYGIRALVGYTITDQASQVTEAERFIAKWQHHPLIRPAAAPHSLYAISEQILCATRDLAHATTTPLMLHFAESSDEARIIYQKYHLTACQVLEKTKLSDNKLILAHAVHLTTTEIEQLSTYAVGMIHCPTSNMKLGSGIAPLIHAQKCRIPIGLGSDGAASNNVLNMFAEMKTATLLQRTAHQSGSVFTADQALELATIGGAHALHAEQYIGSIEPGKFADIITISLNGIHQLPSYNIASTLVYASYPIDVQTVIINGVVKMEHRKLVYPAHQIEQVYKNIVRYRTKVICENRLIHGP